MFNSYLFQRPNPGFMKQLQIFELMDYRVNFELPLYRAYKLENIAELIQLGNAYNFRNLANFFLNRKENLNNQEDNTTSYKCKKCR